MRFDTHNENWCMETVMWQMAVLKYDIASDMVGSQKRSQVKL